MATVVQERLFGKAIRRREDPRFITGRGQYVDDVKLPGMTYAAFVRSPHAHARIRRIDTSGALKHPGVVAVFTGKDMAGVNSLPCGWDLRKEKNIPGVVQDLAMVPHMPLTADVARHVGDPVAVVIAESQAAAVDAVDRVKVDWEPLPSVTVTDRAARSGAPQIHTGAPGNVAFKWEIGDRSATDAAFKGAATTVKKRILNQRLVANAMEPRACIARFDTATGELTLWVTSQNPHVHRLLMCAFVLGIPEHKVRVIAPDVGGGFGSKIFLYNEEVVCSWASRKLKRPVRWTANRREAYQTLVAVSYDSGDYAAAFDKLLQMLDYKKFRAEQAASRKQGRLLGIGFSTYIEACSIAPSKLVGALGAGAGLYESAKVRVHPTGGVTVYTGSHSHGQGHETTFAQLVADELQIPIEQVDIVHGDTGAIPFGMGTYGSRSASVGGTAILMSLNKIKEKGRRIAAHLLEASPNDIEYVKGQFQVKGVPSKAVPFGAVSLTAYVPHKYPDNLEPGLEETSFYDPSNFCFPFGAHACVVEVDRDTGTVKILRYVAVDDVGKVINPMIVDGMVHGGIAQGVGQALWEGAVYDEGSGQLVTGSMMDYALPKADMLPLYETDRTVTPTPVNPLGIKGAGETGTIAATSTVVNAVVDALAPLGIDHIEAMPLTSERVWKAIQAAKATR